MQSKRFICLRLLTVMLMLSAFTFGGGFVIIPLMTKYFVNRYGWVTDEEMLNMFAMAQCTPGAVTVNLAAQLGFRLAGAAGAFCAVGGTLLPPLVWLSVISLFYDAFRSSPVVDALLRSMQPAVAAVILAAGFSLLKPLLQKKSVSGWLIFGTALALGLVFDVNIVLILLAGAAFGALSACREAKRHAD